MTFLWFVNKQRGSFLRFRAFNNKTQYILTSKDFFLRRNASQTSEVSVKENKWTTHPIIRTVGKISFNFQFIRKYRTIIQFKNIQKYKSFTFKPYRTYNRKLRVSLWWHSRQKTPNSSTDWSTLRSLLSVLFYQTTCFEFFQMVSM